MTVQSKSDDIFEDCFGGKTGIKNRVKIVIYFGVNFEIVKTA